MTKLLTILRGIPGCGKSTHAKELMAQSPLTVYCSADDFFCQNPNNEYRFDPTKLVEAHAYCRDTVIQAMIDEVDIIVDNTNIRLPEFTTYLMLVKLAKYKVKIIDFKALSIDRIRKCAERNVHGVPVNVLLDMAYKMDNLEKIRAWCVEHEIHLDYTRVILV